MKKVVWILVVGCIVSAALVLSILRWGRAERQNAPETVRAVRRDIGSAVKATGVIKPKVGALVRVGSRASGVVAHLHVRIGDPVEKGQLLAELDESELVARRDQAAAALASARAQLDFATTDLARKRALIASQVIAAEELDLAIRAHAVARERVAEAAANLSYARTQLGFVRITAPMSGVVSSVSTQEGETVSASLAAPTFLTLVDLQRLEVWAYVDETDIGRIEAGQTAYFTVDTYPNERFEGTVSAVHPLPEIRDNVVNYVTVVEFEAPALAKARNEPVKWESGKPERTKRILRPEMTTTVSIAIEKHENVLTIPRSAVAREQGGTFVYSQNDGAIVKQAVRCGARDDDYWEIVEGLREGEAVLVGRPSPAEGEAR